MQRVLPSQLPTRAGLQTRATSADQAFRCKPRRYGDNFGIGSAGVNNGGASE